MKPLNPSQRRALNIANTRKGGAPIASETPLPKGHVTAYMAGRLTELGWATRVNDTLLITKVGREALNAPIPENPDVFLRAGWGLTTLKRDELRAGIVIDHATLDGFWKQQAETRHAGAADRRERAKRLANMRKAA